MARKRYCRVGIGSSKRQTGERLYARHEYTSTEEAERCEVQVEEIENWLERWSEYEEGDAIHQTRVLGKRWRARERPPSDIYSTGNQPDLRLILVFLAVKMAILE